MEDTAFFCALAKAGGVGTGARVLGLSAPAASRRLRALEGRLGVRLVERSARRFRLTDEGRIFLDRGTVLLAALRDMEAEVSSRGASARGLLRVAAPSDLGRRRIAPALAAFAQQHGGLSIHLTLTDAGAELGEDGLDLAIRTGLPHGADVVARKLAERPRLLCAAPSYLAGHGTPAAIADLLHHRCLVMSRRQRLLDRWTYHGGPGGAGEVAVDGQLSSNDGDVLRSWALAGEGLSLEAEWDVAGDLQAGRLRVLLPDVRWAPATLYATFLPGRSMPPRVRLAIEWLAREFDVASPPAAP